MEDTQGDKVSSEVDALAKQLRLHREDAHHVIACCEKLVRLLADDSDGKRPAAAVARAVRALLAAMDTHLSDADVQEVGCATLRLLLGEGSELLLAPALPAREEGEAHTLLAAALAALRAHAAHAGVQAAGLALVAGLLQRSPVESLAGASELALTGMRAVNWR
jgi:hypothetical protein